MNINMEQVKTYLTEHSLESEESVIDAFYYSCPDLHGPDEEGIKREFGRLDRVLEKLTLREYDEVWDATCRLSIASEKRGFRAGLRSAFRMMAELEKMT